MKNKYRQSPPPPQQTLSSFRFLLLFPLLIAIAIGACSNGNDGTEGDDTLVTSIKLNKNSINLIIGETETLTCTILPNSADKSVTWSSSNSDIASVDSAGKVTAIAEGTASITVTSNDGKKTDTCDITVADISYAGKFAVRLTNITANSEFVFYISATGNFTVDWGDGTSIEQINKTNTNNTDYFHTYRAAGNYTVSFDGLATGYSTNNNTAAIRFASSSTRTKMTRISGSLGGIFPIVDNSSSGTPRFYGTFEDCSGLTSIPGNLFAGISGPPAINMFSSTFSGCSGLTGTIPANLFSGINGASAEGMFAATFRYCRGLTSIPEKLFAEIKGAPANSTFTTTFAGCSGLTSIPEKLFAEIKGAPASHMFYQTFGGCRGLTSIPANLFSGISGAPASYMFSLTFNGCSGLTSIPANLFSGISGAPASYMFYLTFYVCSGLASIPGNLFSGINGASAEGMFEGTFESCSGLTSIPENLFAGVSGAPASRMFLGTFEKCEGLTSIPGNLFSGVSGRPARYMFCSTFSECSRLTSIGSGLFDGIIGDAQEGMFSSTFMSCTNLTGPSATSNGQTLYAKWPSATTNHVSGCYQGATGLSDYASIPATWK